MRRFNVGRVLLLNDPPARRSPSRQSAQQCRGQKAKPSAECCSRSHQPPRAVHVCASHANGWRWPITSASVSTQRGQLCRRQNALLSRVGPMHRDESSLQRCVSQSLTPGGRSARGALHAPAGCWQSWTREQNCEASSRACTGHVWPSSRRAQHRGGGLCPRSQCCSRNSACRAAGPTGDIREHVNAHPAANLDAFGIPLMHVNYINIYGKPLPVFKFAWYMMGTAWRVTDPGDGCWMCLESARPPPGDRQAGEQLPVVQPRRQLCQQVAGAAPRRVVHVLNQDVGAQVDIESKTLKQFSEF